MKIPALIFACGLALAGNAKASDDLLTRMASVNPNLHAFSATMHANVALKTFPFLNMQLVGTYYHKDPDKTKVVFTSGVPGMAEQFNKLYAHVEPPARWHDVYEVSVVKDDGATTTFKLVPRKRGNVEHVDATADDKTATVKSMRWNYVNGGYAEMNDSYATVDGNLLVTAQTGHVQEPGYTADITSTIDNYKINPQLADSLFTEQ